MDTGKIKNLIIDLGGVLVDLDYNRCTENFKKLGIDALTETISFSQPEGTFRLFEKGLISAAEFRDELRKYTPRELTDDQIDYAWNSLLVGIPTYKLDLLLSLRQHYVVYLLSNTNSIHWEWTCNNFFKYKAFRAKDYFEKSYLSFELNAIKPEKEIFRIVLEDTGILPAETLFIDDLPENCATAQALGISTYTPAAGEEWGKIFG